MRIAANTPHASLLERYEAVRARTVQLTATLSPEDAQLQSMPDASPTKWHLAHTSWFFETFILQAGASYQAFHPAYGFLFNSYYTALGPRQERRERGLLSRPSWAEVIQYRTHVDEAMGDRLSAGVDEATASLVVLGLNHEEQHQELLLTDIKHALSRNMLAPAVRASSIPLAAPPAPMRFVDVAGGLRAVGALRTGDDDTFAFDNEGPRHRTFLHPFALGFRNVTAGEYQAFIDDGGYATPAHWLDDGYAFVSGGGITAPLYWQDEGAAVGGGRRYSHFTLHGRRDVDPNAPVTHISFYEADAYARWAGARLCTEGEWEVVASGHDAAAGRFSDADAWHPTGAGGTGAGETFFGDTWVWTQSAYAAYPRFVPEAGAVGEYNGKFMNNQRVLRGGSVATAPGHVRATYRNFFPPSARWQFTGIRLARDLGDEGGPMRETDGA